MSRLEKNMQHPEPKQIGERVSLQYTRVLLVEDNPGDARLVYEMLETGGALTELQTVTNLTAAINFMRARTFDIVLLDLSLPDSTGLETLRKAFESSPKTAFVVMTGLDDELVGDQAVQLGAQSYLVKGQFDEQLLLRTLRHASERQRLIGQLVSEISLRCDLQQTLERSNKDLETRITKRTSELRKVNRALSMLSQCNRAMLHAKTESQLLHDICRLIVGPGAYPLAWIGRIDAAENRLTGLDVHASENDEYIQVLRECWSEIIDRQGPVVSALATGQYVVQRTYDLNGSSKARGELIERCGFTGNIVLPLYVNTRIVGVLVIYSKTNVAFDDNEIELLEGMAADLSFGITALRTGIERERERTELMMFSAALQQTDDIVIITDKEGIVEYVNAAFERVTGFNIKEARGHTPGSLVGGDIETRGDHTEMWHTLMQGEAYHGTFINRRKDGGMYYEQKSITPIKDSDGNITCYLSTGKDITDDLEMQERLRTLLNYDVLTGLPNRNLFLDRLVQMQEQAQWGECGFAIVIVNIDRFKNVNSSLGHQAGDELLRVISQRLKEYFRPVDVVARLVGNTFAIILSDQNDIENIVEYVRILLSFIATPCYVNDREMAVSACVGVAITGHDDSDVTELLRNAEAAMYQAKHRGPNQIEFYNESINDYAANRQLCDTHWSDTNSFYIISQK